MDMKFDTDDFTFKNRTLSLKEVMQSFPHTVTVFSTHTGRTIRFVINQEAAERNEFWDGLMMEYVPEERCNVDRLVIVSERD